MRQVVVVRPPQEKEKRRTEVKLNRVSYNPYARAVNEKKSARIIYLD